MKKIAEIHIVLLFCCFAPFLPASEKGEGRDAIDLGKVLQALRPYNSIECEYIEDVSTDNGKTWKISEKGTIIWDRKNDFYRHQSMTRDPAEKIIWMEEVIRKDNRNFTLPNTFKEGAEWEPTGKPIYDSEVIITPATPGYVPFDWLIFPYRISRSDLKSLLDANKIKASNFAQEGTKLKLTWRNSVFVFDSSSGRLESRSRSFVDPYNGREDSNTTTFSDFLTVNNWEIPACMSIRQETKEKTILSRYRFKKDSLKVNELRNKEAFKFSSPIAAGTVIDDHTKNIRYRAVGPVGSGEVVPAEDIGKELDAIFDEATKTR